MKILITGGGGQLAFDLIRVLAPDHELSPFSKTELDVTESSKVTAIISRLKPDIIIHTAAFTDVDLAEAEPEYAYQVNAFGTKNVAYAAAVVGARLVYISTDYVFDGKKGSPYTELDRPLPLGIYGYSKLLGEKFVKAFIEKHFIVRTAWLFGKQGNNFVEKVVALSSQKKSIFAVTDQIGSPTYSLDLTYFIGYLIQTEKYGIYHATNQGQCSKYEFVQAILKEINGDRVHLIPTTLEKFQLPAKRPVNSALDHFNIRTHQLPLFRGWESALHDFLSNDF